MSISETTADQDVKLIHADSHLQFVLLLHCQEHCSPHFCLQEEPDRAADCNHITHLLHKPAATVLLTSATHNTTLYFTEQLIIYRRDTAALTSRISNLSWSLFFNKHSVRMFVWSYLICKFRHSLETCSIHVIQITLRIIRFYSERCFESLLIFLNQQHDLTFSSFKY